jgi:hypothetical protein
MKLILQFLKRITLFLKNKSNALEDNNTGFPESEKKNLLKKIKMKSGNLLLCTLHGKQSVPDF